MKSIPRFSVAYGADDYAAGLFSLLRSRPEPATGFQGLLGERPMSWTSSGQQALCLILRALELPAGAGVAIPLYGDSSTASAVRAAGLRPVFVDVDSRTMTMDPESLYRVRREIDVVLAVHLFGHVAHLDELRNAADGAVLVEDTAHSPLSYFGDRMTGTIGRACFYSFASTKYWPAGGGGLAVANDPELGARLERLTAELNPPKTVTEIRRATLQMAKAIAFQDLVYGLAGQRSRSWTESRAILEPTLDRHTIQRPQATVALRHIASFPERVRSQRANSLMLLSLLKDAQDVVLPVERPGVTYNYHLFPVLLRDAAELDAVRAEMRRRSVDSSRIYFDNIERARAMGYRGGCPNAESCIQRMFTLPNAAVRSEAEIAKVAEVFLEALHVSRRSRARRAASAAGTPVTTTEEVA